MEYIKNCSIGDMSLEDLEREAIERTLKFFKGNVMATAKSLGMLTSKNTLKMLDEKAHRKMLDEKAHKAKLEMLTSKNTLKMLDEIIEMREKEVKEIQAEIGNFLLWYYHKNYDESTGEVRNLYDAIDHYVSEVR